MIQSRSARRGRRAAPRRWAVVAAVAVVAVVAGCTRPPAPPPDTTAPPTDGRYRTEVFSDVSVTRDIAYHQAPGRDGSPQTLRLDLYQPAGDTVSRRPAIVFAHGGAFMFGNKGSGVSPEQADYFARRGYVTVSIAYRLLVAPGDSCTGFNSSASCRTAAVEATKDGMEAVRWLRTNASTHRIDPDRIAFGGESAGAIMATGVGITNRVDPGVSSEIRAFQSISGGLPPEDLGAEVDAGDAAGILFTGTSDRIVPVEWSADTAAALTRVGVTARSVAVEGGHVPWTGASKAAIQAQTTEFFYQQLDLANAGR